MQRKNRRDGTGAFLGCSKFPTCRLTASTGVLKDDAEAAKWYREYAEQGHAVAQTILGLMYFDGRGVPHNFLRAHIWFSIAAAQGDEKAKRSQALTASEMTPDQIAEAQRMAREWMAKHQQ